MTPRIDEFFDHPSYGRMKFRGVAPDGNYLFTSYTRLGDSVQTGDLFLPRDAFDTYITTGRITPSVPPQ